MQQQTVTVALIVVVTFGAGFLTGRMSVAQAPAPAPAAPAGPGAKPFAPFSNSGAPPSSEPSAVSGTLAEVIQVPNFTYLRITTANGDEWAAISANNSLSVGQPVRLGTANLMENFQSKTLNRTFPRIWFGELAGVE